MINKARQMKDEVTEAKRKVVCSICSIDFKHIECNIDFEKFEDKHIISQDCIDEILLECHHPFHTQCLYHYTQNGAQVRDDVSYF